jgi:hypothetical protein
MGLDQNNRERTTFLPVMVLSFLLVSLIYETAFSQIQIKELPISHPMEIFELGDKYIVRKSDTISLVDSGGEVLKEIKLSNPIIDVKYFDTHLIFLRKYSNGLLWQKLWFSDFHITIDTLSDTTLEIKILSDSTYLLWYDCFAVQKTIHSSLSKKINLPCGLIYSNIFAVQENFIWCIVTNTKTGLYVLEIKNGKTSLLKKLPFKHKPGRDYFCVFNKWAFLIRLDPKTNTSKIFRFSFSHPEDISEIASLPFQGLLIGCNLATAIVRYAFEDRIVKVNLNAK